MNSSHNTGICYHIVHILDTNSLSCSLFYFLGQSGEWWSSSLTDITKSEEIVSEPASKGSSLGQQVIKLCVDPSLEFIVYCFKYLRSRYVMRSTLYRGFVLRISSSIYSSTPKTPAAANHIPGSHHKHMHAVTPSRIRRVNRRNRGVLRERPSRSQDPVKSTQLGTRLVRETRHLHIW